MKYIGLFCYFKIYKIDCKLLIKYESNVKFIYYDSL